jgi:hypothetical protein
MSRAAPVLLCAALGGCLPDDVRDPPAELLVTAEPSEGTRGSFTTADGWTIRVETLALTLGRAGFVPTDDESCEEYSFTYYSWLVDYAAAGREKIALLHGLGTCQVRFETQSIGPLTRLGAGASIALAAEMDTANLLFVATATKGEIDKRLVWHLAMYTALGSCVADVGSPLPLITPLESGQPSELGLVVRAEGLFEEPFDDEHALRADFLLDADLDDDGLITGYEAEVFVGYVAWSGEGNTFVRLSGVVNARDGWWCPQLEPY